MTATLYGGIGSPYSLKMRAVLRYRRIPFIWVHDQPAMQQALAKVSVPVVPVLIDADGRARNDSTPLILALDAEIPDRQIVPPDPVLAYLACLIEDFADEWGTKIMFWYRWARAQDQAALGLWLAADMFPGAGRATIDQTAAMFRQRQIGRMPLVGCTPENAPIIEASYMRLLGALEALLPSRRFLFGTRPSLADFALYGQLAQLGSDPTPAAIMRDAAPYTLRWLAHVEDCSGVDGDWQDPGASLDSIFDLIADVYLPFLAANAAALTAGDATVATELLGQPYQQAPFKYQAKCLQELKARYAALSPEQQAHVPERVRLD
jgi:glutathione S-transferase